MSQALIVPDIHERTHVIDLLKPKMDAADHVYLLGDYFDNWKQDAGRAKATCEWIKEIASDLKYTKLLGNHDIHYISQSPAVRASGYNDRTQSIIWKELDWNRHWSNFELFAVAGPYTLSHAGFTNDTRKLASPVAEKDALENMRKSFSHEFFAAGYARGGRHAIGGPLWLDWNDEFEPIEGLPQIVGHTQGKDIRVKQHSTPAGNADRSFCVDTSSHHIVWIDEMDGKLEFEEVTW